MTVNPILKTIRAKKIGVLIRDARIKSGKSETDCADAMGISIEDFSMMELGEKPPTLPELESLAYCLEIPLEHFWENSILRTEAEDRIFDAEGIKQIRQKAIGALLRKSRIESVMSADDLALQAGIDREKLEAYERGEVPILLPDLEVLCQVLDKPIVDYQDQGSKIGNWFSEKRNVKEFLSLPLELQAFIGKPVNRPYLALAIKISELKVEKIRDLAEGLLEITL